MPETLTTIAQLSDLVVGGQNFNDPDVLVIIVIFISWLVHFNAIGRRRIGQTKSNRLVQLSLSS